MKSKLSKCIIAFTISILGVSLFNLTPIVHAAGDICSQDKSTFPPEVWEAAGCNGNSNALPGLITGILNAIIAVSGIVAVIFVLIGGVNYMTSAGDSGKLEKAKKTIIYAAIGLAIVALSFTMVNFVIVDIIPGRSSTDNSQQENANNAAQPKANSANTPKQETK